MNCDEYHRLLSIYHDGELDSEQRARLEVHLEGCAHCSTELAEIRRISTATRSVISPKPGPELWQRISASLQDGRPPIQQPSGAMVSNVVRDELPRRRRLLRRPVIAVLSISVVLLVGLTIAWSFLLGRHGQHAHDPLEQYVQQFSSEPVLAQRSLLKKYSGRLVAAEEAIRLVGYRPSNIKPPPQGYTRDSLYVLDMPCCKCIQAVWQRSDGTCVAIFEHSAGIEDRFKGYSSVRVACGGKSCRLIGIDNQFAASWKLDQRIVTVIGLRDTDELATIVAEFS